MSHTNPLCSDTAAEADFDNENVPWEVLETIAVVVLVAIGVLALGGLVGALIFVNSDEVLGGFSSQATWNAVGRGASWSGPLITMILLGVMGISWFQARSWAVPANAQSDTPAVFTHLHRTVRIAGWTVVGLVLSLLGAVASVASVIGFNWSSISASYFASLAVPVGASALAVLLLASAGLWIYVQTRRIAQLPGQREGSRPAPADPAFGDTRTD
jgi:hypothetical protein